MAGQSFYARIAGKTKLLFGIQSSAGVADAGKIIATDATGKIDESLLPEGIGANSVSGTASEAIAAGKFVNLWDNGGVLALRLADNSNGRPAWGYTKETIASAGVGTVYRLNTINANMSGLTPGAEQWLGTAGGVISVPLDPTVDTGKVDQFLGIAQSATELVTAEYEPIYL